MKTSPDKRPPARHATGPDEELAAMLKHLRLGRLLAQWDETLEPAREEKYSPERFLRQVIEREYQAKRENARILRR